MQAPVSLFFEVEDFCFSLPGLDLKRLTEELMTRKREDIETKHSCWTGKLAKIWAVSLPQSRLSELTIP